MELQFRDRYVTSKGTVYCEFIGNSRTYNKDNVEEKSKLIKNLVGQQVSINGKLSTVLQARINGACNMTDVNYYAEILTDEEFIKEFEI